MDCSNCGAPLPARTIRCTFCNSLNDIDLRGRVTVSRGQSKRVCPRCKTEMVAVMLGVTGQQVELDQCKTCQGLFFDPGELDTILEGIEKQAHTVDHRQLMTLIEQETPTDDFANVAYAPCPDCGKLMNRRNFGQKSGVVIDDCREHGIWLDGGELRRLIRWTQAGGRQHHIESVAAKREMDAKLAAIPSTVPTNDDYRVKGGGLLFDDGNDSSFGTFDVIDTVQFLGSLARFFR